MSKETEAEAANYYSKDFEWDQLRLEIERDPSFLYHLLPFIDGTNTNNVVETSAAASNQKGFAKDSDSEAWSKFHSCHSTGKFFKERRYLLKEFPELASCRDYAKVLEVGCGNGSTALPILRAKENIVVYTCDCSNEALDRAKENVAAANLTSVEHRFHSFLCDISVSGVPNWLACSTCQERFCKSNVMNCNRGDFCESSCSEENSCCVGGVNLVTLIFTLSALPLHRMPTAIQECFSVLKPGGMLLFRDYEWDTGNTCDLTEHVLISSLWKAQETYSLGRDSPSLSWNTVVLDLQIGEMGKLCEGCGFMVSSRNPNAVEAEIKISLEGTVNSNRLDE